MTPDDVIKIITDSACGVAAAAGSPPGANGPLPRERG